MVVLEQVVVSWEWENEEEMTKLQILPDLGSGGQSHCPVLKENLEGWLVKQNDEQVMKEVMLAKELLAWW